jgi:membrane protein DedA with SNARE-associated domain
LKNRTRKKPARTKNKKRTGGNIGTNILRALAVLAVIAISIFIFSIRDRVQEFAAFGYPGIFLIALLANATVFLPAPGIAVVFAMGSVFHPLGVGLAAGTGGALGELSGYLAGVSGQAVVERSHLYQQVHPWVKKYGPWAIMVLSIVPNPVFDLAGVAAGAVRMPLWQFLLFCWVGQLIKMTFFAYSGAYSLTWLVNFFQP